MTRFVHLSCVLILAGGTKLQSAQPAGAALPTIEVSGSALVEATPDMLFMSLSIKNNHENSERVADDHLALVERVRAALRAQKVVDADVHTSNMTFGEHQVLKNGERAPQGFIATTAMTVRAKDLNSYVPLWKGLAKVQGVSVEQVAFDHEQRPRFQDEARENALRAARHKAMAMAAVYGCAVGQPVSIKERETTRYFFGTDGINGPGSPRSSEQITGSGGKLQIRAEVEVTFQLTTAEKVK